MHTLQSDGGGDGHDDDDRVASLFCFLGRTLMVRSLRLGQVLAGADCKIVEAPHPQACRPSEKL